MKFLQAKKQAELFAVIYIRKIVFIDEQKVSIDEEFDNLDFDADHYLLKVRNEFIATSRVYYKDNEATIGRVAVLKPHRKKGYAKYLMQETLKIVKAKKIDKIHLGAQVQAVGFYEKLGFKVSGDLYLDANIEHYPMELVI